MNIDTYKSSNAQMVIGYNGKQNLLILSFLKYNIYSGEVDYDINFTYEDNTEVRGSCAASLHDEMWVLGSYSKKRQVNF